MTPAELHDLAAVAESAGKKAAAHIRDQVGSHRVVNTKNGSGSLASQVVTEVDMACQDLILSELAPTLHPERIGLLTEEQEDDSTRLRRDFFWCIDPLDGTLPFIEGISGYSVSIALVSRCGTSQLGIVVDPVSGDLFSAVKGQGLTLNGSPFPLGEHGDRGSLRWMMNRSMKTHPQFDDISARVGKLSLDLGLDGVETSSTSGGVLHACRVLREGPAIYFTLPKTGTGGGSIWDYAATACLFGEAGIPVTTPRGDRLHLNHSETTFMSHCGVLYASSLRLRRAVQDLCSHYLP